MNNEPKLFWVDYQKLYWTVLHISFSLLYLIIGDRE
jgi:hypothetical protein